MKDEQAFNPDWFSKPGDSLRSVMQRRGVAARDLAQSLDGGMALLRGILDGSIAIDAEKAKALAKSVGGAPDFWLKRQANYEAALERALNIASQFEQDEWFARVPGPRVTSHARPSAATLREELRQRLVFFNVANMRSWEARYGQLCDVTRFRTSPSFTSKDSAVLWWLRRGELEADLVSTRPWDADALYNRMDDIRRLSRVGRPERFFPKLRQICSEAGVALVVVKTPKGCHASGASRLVSPDKAMILLSFRHRSDDHFWFTLFHEIGHLLLHGAETFVDGEGMVEDDREREANQFAASRIVPDARRAEFEELPATRDAVLRYSVSVGVSAGLIVGQMQHRKMIDHGQLNTLKRYWTWADIEPALA